MDITIAIIGAVTSIVVAIFGSIYLNISNIKLQNRKLKEEYYVKYIEALHWLAANNSDKEALKNYTLYRDKMFIIASEHVVKSIIDYEEKGVGKNTNVHDLLLTRVYMSIRKDLKIRDKEFPTIYLKRA